MTKEELIKEAEKMQNAKKYPCGAKAVEEQTALEKVKEQYITSRRQNG